MRKVLLIVILLLAGCGAPKDVAVKSKEPVYCEQVLQGQISMEDYFYLIDAEKELNEMKGVKK